ncbi:MAG: ArsA family ATPase [Myxococcota bacterium]
MTTPALDRRFLFVVGKGGVGKTSISAALALAAAKRGKRVLVAMCNTKERISHLLETDPVGEEVGTVAEGVDAVNMSPQAALREYGAMVLKVRTVYTAVFENRLVSAFLRGVPGIEAWSMLGKAYFHTKETDEQDQPKYDLVIVDAPATGHGLDMLRVPQVLLDVAPPGLLRREAEGAMELFRDPTRGGIVLCTIPEDMPTNETLELHEALTEELELPIASLVINAVLPPLFDDSHRRLIAELQEKDGASGPFHSLLEAGRRRATREQIQTESIQRLRSGIEAPVVKLPQLFVPEFRRSAIESLSHCF